MVICTKRLDLEKKYGCVNQPIIKYHRRKKNSVKIKLTEMRRFPGLRKTLVICLLVFVFCLYD